MFTLRIIALTLFIAAYFGVVTANIDEGNGFDPHGRPVALSQGDEGNGIDPHG